MSFTTSHPIFADNEVSKVINVSDLAVMGSKLLVIWKWTEWFTAADELELESSSDDERNDITETPLTETSDSDIDTMEEASASLNHTTHTVTFKCIGCHKEVRYQQALARASQLRNNSEQVLCKFECEPNNPFDSQAIGILQAKQMGENRLCSKGGSYRTS